MRRVLYQDECDVCTFVTLMLAATAFVLCLYMNVGA